MFHTNLRDWRVPIAAALATLALAAFGTACGGGDDAKPTTISAAGEITATVEKGRRAAV
jgi:hypothetical protein